MRAFDQLLQDDIAAYEGRHDDLIYQAPALYRLLVQMLDDPLLPGRLRPLVIGAVAYFILPADVIPEDIHGPYGYVDDIFLCAFIADRVRQELGTDDILIGNWDGEAPLVPLLRDILAREVDLIGDRRSHILQYIGYDYLETAARARS
ncbi:MAG: YkvA family protein [Anaerolineae bacterium]